MSNNEKDNANKDIDNENDQIESVDDLDRVEINGTDEFEDDIAFDDENAFLEDDSDHDAFNDVETKSSSSMNWFNIGIIGFVIIGITGISYIFLPGLFGGNTSQMPSQQQTQVAQSQQQTASTSQPEQPAPRDNNEPMGLLQNPDLILTEDDMRAIESQIVAQDNSRVFDALNQPEKIEAEGLFDAVRGQGNVEDIPYAQDAPQFVPNAPNADMNTDFDTLPMPSDSDMVDLDLENMFEPLPEIQAEPPVETPVAEETFEPAQEVEAVVATPETVNMDNRLDNLEASIEIIMNRLDSLGLANAQPTPTAQPADNSAIQSLRDTIATLDNKIASLNTQIQETQSQPKPSLTPMPEPEPQPESKSAAPTPKVTETPKTSQSRPAAPRIQYDLRGVSNGIAYIARKGTDNLQPVAVGNTVQGLGRITSIEQQSGRWVVRGSSGSVRQ